jgi:hypothetical protein
MSAIIATLVGGFALYIGFRHNPQMEFFDTETGKVDYGYSLLLFAVWFCLTFVPFVALGWIGRLILKLMARTR